MRIMDSSFANAGSGTFSYLRFVDEDLTVIVLTNLSSASSYRIGEFHLKK